MGWILLFAFLASCSAGVADEDLVLFGALVGGLLGWLVKAQREGSRRLTELQQRIDRVEAHPAPAPLAEPQPLQNPPREPAVAEAPQPQPLQEPPQAPAVAPLPATPPPAPRPTPPPREPGPFATWARGLLFGGNTVARVGLLVLLVGVVLLLKWAADNNHFPPAARLAASAAIGVGLVGFGFRKRTLMPGFSYTLQGGGLAALYLVVFFGLRVYELIPTTPAFILLVAIAGLGAALAVLQDAMALAVIATLGAFAAPSVASSGSGDHVALFSYYLLLNLSITGIAWFKPWRALNLIGFVSTFVLGASWGALSYEADKAASTEPFLVAFFLLYYTLPLLLADREAGPRRGWVNGSIVFGAPPIFLILQHQLVGETEWGMAFTALLAAALYLVGGRWLRERRPETMTVISEAYLAIGVGFLTLAIPYALGNHSLTGASWAVEGAGLYWLGLRQRRRLARGFGVLLQPVGALGFGLGAGQVLLRAEADWQAGPLLGAALVVVAVFFVARQAWRHREQLLPVEGPLLQALIPLGLVVWGGTVITEAAQFAAQDHQLAIVLGTAGATCAALELAGRRLGWLPGRATASLAALLVPLPVLIWDGPLYGNGGAFAWPLLLGAVLLSWRRLPAEGPPWARHLRPVALWSLTFFAAVGVGLHAREELDLTPAWSASLLGAVVIGALAAALRGSRGDAWPFGEAPGQTVRVSAAGLVAALALWLVVGTASLSADASPLPSLPLLNPVDLSQLGALAAMVAWIRAHRRHPGPVLVPVAWLSALVPGLLFLWFNGLLARTVHASVGGTFSWWGLWDVVAFQVAVSVSWAIIGMTVTVWASRAAHRTAWLVGATVLGVVVGKLALVDPSAPSTVARIATFLVVGLLLLAVGYFAPVPPSVEGEDR